MIDADASERILDWIAESGGEVLAGGDTTGDGADPPDRDRRAAAGRQGLLRGDLRPRLSPSPPTTVLDEAIELANGTEYGLQAGIFTADVKTALARRPRGSSSAA